MSEVARLTVEPTSITGWQSNAFPQLLLPFFSLHLLLCQRLLPLHLLWADVPMPLYASKDSTRTFKVRKTRRGKSNNGAKKVKVHGSPCVGY